MPGRFSAIHDRRKESMLAEICRWPRPGGDGDGCMPLMQQRRRPGRKPLVNHSALYPYSRFRRERRSMPHSIEVWRAVISTARSLLLLAKGMAGDELLLADEGNVVLAELSRRYPGLSRDVAEYLAR